MDGYRGTVVCDALKTHEAGARGNDALVLAGCWAHVFRKFEEAVPDHPEAQLALKWIAELYAIDDRAEGDLTKRAELRRTESAAVIATMRTWLWQQAVLKTLSIGHAAAYVVANWDRLTRFLQDPRIPLDNNATERGIRGPVVGRKNHYGSKSRRGTEVASVFYSLIETAKLQQADPARYLREAALADGRGETLLPYS
jgi:transposase